MFAAVPDSAAAWTELFAMSGTPVSGIDPIGCGELVGDVLAVF
jgi:hypothetical protein